MGGGVEKSLVLYKLLNTLCSEHYVHLLTFLSTANSDYGLKRILSFTKITLWCTQYEYTKEIQIPPYSRIFQGKMQEKYWLIKKIPGSNTCTTKWMHMYDNSLFSFIGEIIETESWAKAWPPLNKFNIRSSVRIWYCYSNKSESVGWMLTEKSW